jgi:hypothetical protein
MPRITVNVSEDVEEWLEAEGDRLNWSKADAGGHCIEVMYRTVQHIDVNQLDAEDPFFAGEAGTGGPTDVSETVDERLAAIEARLDHLTSALDTTGGGEPSPSPRDDAPAETSGDHRESPPDAEHGQEPPETDVESDDTVDEHADSAITDVLSGWSPGRSDDERIARIIGGRAALEWLRERDDHASGSDFKRALYPDHAPEDQGEDTFWKKTARPAVQRAVDAGLVEYREGHHDYRWVGDDDTDSDTSSVYDPTSEFE